MNADILDIGGTAVEALGLRSILEYWQVKVNLHLISTSTELVNLLGAKNMQASSTIILCCHGDKNGLCMPQLAPEILVKQQYKGSLNAKQLSEFLCLPNCLVINTGCLLGSETFAAAFLNAGCRAYIGATGYPEGDSTMFYILNFFYELICHGSNYKKAHSIASKYDRETKLFKMYEKTKRGNPIVSRAVY